jgi:hypothetical protein
MTPDPTTAASAALRAVPAAEEATLQPLPDRDEVL